MVTAAVYFAKCLSFSSVHIFADINECNDQDTCSHGCENTEGSFQCQCPGNVPLGTDGRTCLSKLSSYYQAVTHHTDIHSGPNKQFSDT